MLASCGVASFPNNIGVAEDILRWLHFTVLAYLSTSILHRLFSSDLVASYDGDNSGSSTESEYCGEEEGAEDAQLERTGEGDTPDAPKSSSMAVAQEEKLKAEACLRCGAMLSDATVSDTKDAGLSQLDTGSCCRTCKHESGNGQQAAIVPALPVVQKRKSDEPVSTAQIRAGKKQKGIAESSASNHRHEESDDDEREEGEVEEGGEGKDDNTPCASVYEPERCNRCFFKLAHPRDRECSTAHAAK